MENDKLLVPNMFSVLIFKHIFSNLPPDYHEMIQIWATTMKLTRMLPLKVYLFTVTDPQLERGTKLKMTELFPFKVLSSVEVASHCNNELSQITYNVSIIVCSAVL